MMHVSKRQSLPVILAVLLTACTSSAVKSSDSSALANAKPAAPTPSNVSRMTATQTEGCDTSNPSVTMPRDQRKEVINNVVAEAEKESKSPDVFEDEKKRMQVGTFAAGILPDSVPFISMDRDCWASFYDAQNALNENNDVEAKKAADVWASCLASNFPARLEYVKPYLSCFKK